MTEQVLFSWSGGKDSALAFYELQKIKKYEIVALLTTITQDYDRVSMHGVRRVLLERQAESLGLLLEKILISNHSTNEEYETKMRTVLERYQRQGVDSVVFGDIFLEDLKKYREERLAQIGLHGVFPIWMRDSSELARSFVTKGFQAITTCVDSQVLDQRFVGRSFDAQFVAELPTNVDPCGENGEFHSFVFDGPIFSKKIEFSKGEVVLRDQRFYYCDLLPRSLEV